MIRKHRQRPEPDYPRPILAILCHRAVHGTAYNAPVFYSDEGQRYQARFAEGVNQAGLHVAWKCGKE